MLVMTDDYYLLIKLELAAVHFTPFNSRSIFMLNYFTDRELVLKYIIYW